ncbi:hypothetical protein HPB48_006141 [Haemaphysalis longicornis]|uniref:Nicotinamide N-methyltransferase n=1 Tax=Haemaphysalis longicornis TaxID=44386 RepID=A0A9J6GXR2_HAELO|nr:hypothetical protein HPB48_006141 [Haemaphysalis longicornis]
MEQLRLVEHIRSEFSPDNYPAHSMKMMPLLDFMRQELHKIFTSDLVKAGGKLLEVGCGPTMYTAMSASLAFNDIVMADLVPANIRERQMPRTGRCSPSAKPSLKAMIDVEKGASTIIARTRNAIRDVTLCNICEPGSSVDEAAHQRATANLAGLLNPGGLLIACGLTGNSSYTACTKTFSSLDSDEALIKKSITKAGLKVVQWAEDKHLSQMDSYISYGTTYVIVGMKTKDA